MAIKITNDELLQFRNAAQQFIQRYNDRTPLHYALEKMLKKTKTAADDYSDKENDHRSECALIDKETKKYATLDDKRTIAIDPEKMKSFQKKIRVLLREEIEVEPHYATSIPADLDAMWYQWFLGIVIKEEDDPILKKMAKQPDNGVAVKEQA